MTKGLSIWLDALRVWATLVVVLSHLAYPRFTRGDYIFLRELNLGSDAVIVFFVISGLVIAYAAGRDGTLPRYSFNRLTRLISVLFPALVLTYAFDQIGQLIGPEAYSSFYNPAPYWELMARGLTMSNEWAAPERLRLGTNGPLWSLSYEAAYYAIFAAAFYLSGLRRIAVVALFAAIAGPRVLLLMPAWVMGTLLWRWIAAGGPARLPQASALALAIAGPALYVAAQWADLPAILTAQTALLTAPLPPRAVLVFSDECLWNALIGLMTTAHIMGMARLLQDYKRPHLRIRWWAGASFSIYVTHYPALHLIDAAFPAETLARDGLLLAGSVLTGLAFAALFERPLPELRRRLKALRPRSLSPMGDTSKGLAQRS